MPKGERTLRQCFLEFMDQRKAWPSAKGFEGWMRDKKDGIRNGVYSKMQNGLSVDVKYVVALVSFFHANTNAKLHEESAKAFFEYLKSIGIDNPSEMSPSQLTENLLEVDEDDYFQQGFLGILEAFRGSRFVEASVQGCKEKDVLDVVRWLFITVGREVDPRQAPDSIDEAISIAQERMRISLDEYRAIALRWWSYDRWTVVRARGPNSAIGMSIVLPLTADAYQSVRKGELAIHSLEARHLQRPSRYLFIEAVAERPVDAGGVRSNMTRRLLAAIFSQASILSHREDSKTEQALHVLTRAGTPKSERRAKSLGYKKTGNRLLGESCEMLERIMAWPYSPDQLIVDGLSAAIGRNADRFLIPPDGPYSKKPRTD